MSTYPHIGPLHNPDNRLPFSILYWISGYQSCAKEKSVMDISEALFTEITGLIPSPPAEDLTIERRRHSRVLFGMRGRLFPVFAAGPTRGLPVMVRDLSRSGVGLLFSEPLLLGDEFIVHLPRQSGVGVQIQCMVKRCEPGGTGGGNFVIGAAFELVLNEPAPTHAGPEMIENSAPWCARPASRSSVSESKPDRRDPWLKVFWKGLASVTRLNRSDARIRRRLRVSKPTDYTKKFASHWTDPNAPKSATTTTTTTKQKSPAKSPPVLTKAEREAVDQFWS